MQSDQERTLWTMERIPLRLNLRVNVLPQPGTGHMKCASFRLLLAEAAWVADVVTCCFSTWRIGGRRGIDGREANWAEFDEAWESWI